ncbi:unnamed protein product [Rotaria magnacalcarata]|uniref:Uncharacterized protein n=1 Tax=Rotaria magnacalcarata TaxID=392030 RepID=A0A814KEI1_9BILA|nr:unnamed protein product [Rotaria magnacalcarata]CAF1333206.1 unnamed protein product [Rotaria magnacalcarata]CAF1940197.1 unnamed protein product [Rotaria magnacalcarata]CAF2084641.1 unnamed protein product [Rotaria magnacalcarata]CAF2247598.1 unnamed protein product [Rotaria magnacalcarata]
MKKNIKKIYQHNRNNRNDNVNNNDNNDNINTDNNNDNNIDNNSNNNEQPVTTSNIASTTLTNHSTILQSTLLDPPSILSMSSNETSTSEATKVVRVAKKKEKYNSINPNKTTKKMNVLQSSFK